MAMVSKKKAAPLGACFCFGQKNGAGELP